VAAGGTPLHPTGSVPDMTAQAQNSSSYRRDAEPPPVERKPVPPVPASPPPPRHEYREAVSLSVGEEEDDDEEVTSREEAARPIDDDEMSDYYQLRRKPVPRDVRTARPSSANQSKDQQGSKRKDKAGKSDGAAKTFSRPVSAPFDRVENQHTYRTKSDASAGKTNRVAHVRSASPSRKAEVKPKPQPVHNILLPGGIYTTGLQKATSKRVQPSSASSVKQQQARGAASYGRRDESPQRPPSSGGYAYNNHGHKEKVRPSSTSAPRPLSSTGRTLSRSEQQRLNQMYQADMIDHLDDAILSRGAAAAAGDMRRESSAGQNSSHSQSSGMRHSESAPTLMDRHYQAGGDYGTVPLGQQQR
jgi:hypothetical protein